VRVEGRDAGASSEKEAAAIPRHEVAGTSDVHGSS
jgi:hypothetical protein